MTNTRTAFFFLDSAILFVSPPPLVRGVGCHDRVGRKSQAFVSGCPISICIPGDRDEVLHRSSSTKDGTLCPVSYSSALIICIGPGTEWWSTRWIHWIWLKDSIGGRCWCFGIWCQRKCRSTRRNGGVGRGLSTMARVDFSVVNGSWCWCGIAVRVVRVESIGSSFWGNWKRARSDFFLDHWHWSCRRSGQFLSIWVAGQLLKRPFEYSICLLHGWSWVFAVQEPMDCPELGQDPTCELGCECQQGWLTNVLVPYKMEDARWWDEGWVQDFPPCVTECLRESPLWVTLTMEVKERKCGDFLVLRVQDGNFEEALSPPIQWRARKREEVLPNSSNASEPEPDDDGKHDLEHDPSKRVSLWDERSKRKLSQEAAKRQRRQRRDKQQEKRKPNRQQTLKERRQANQTTNEQKADKPAGNPCLTLWSKVLMLNQRLVRYWLELLLGKPSAGVQMN